MDTVFQTESYRNYALCWSGGIGGEADTECVIPDSMPDVVSIVDCDAIVSIRSKECESGRFRAGTELSVHVLYQGEDSHDLHSLSLTMSCDLNSAAAEIDSSCHSQLQLRLRGLDARILNSRKISLHAELIGQASCYRRQEFSIPHSIQSPLPHLQILKKSAGICVVSDLREKTFVITTDQSLPADCEAPESILLQRVQLICDSSGFVGEKMIFRGRAKIFLLLQCDNGPKICSFETEFSQVMELQGESEPAPQVTLLLTGAYFDLPEHGGGKINCELHILAQAAAMKSPELEYIADLYSNQQALQPSWDTEPLCASMRYLSLERSIDGHGELPPDAQMPLYTKAVINGLSPEADGLSVSLSVKTVYSRADGSYASAQLRLKESILLPAEEGECMNHSAAVAGDPLCSFSSGSWEARVPLSLTVSLHQPLSLSYVNDIEESAEALPAAASVTLLYAGEEDDLWTLAKKHRSTREAILSANNGREQGLLLVPRTR